MSNTLEGQRVPDVTFRTRKEHEWVELSSADVFAGKSVVVFLIARRIYTNLFVVARTALQSTSAPLRRAWHR